MGEECITSFLGLNQFIQDQEMIEAKEYKISLYVAVPMCLFMGRLDGSLIAVFPLLHQPGV